MTREKKNEVIANFLGIKEVSEEYNHGSYTTEHFKVRCPAGINTFGMTNTFSKPGLAMPEFYKIAKFHSNYNWLMAAWHKFQVTPLVKYHETTHFEIIDRICYALCNKTISDAFEALYDGIYWYNSVTEKQP